MPKVERRYAGTGVAVPAFESRRGTATSTRVLSGMAAVFDHEIELMPRVRERIAPGAFSGVLRDANTRLLVNHNSDLVLARIGNGSLRLRETDRGLHFVAEVGAGGVGDNALDMIRDRRIDQMSFGFVVGVERFEQRRGGDVTRVIETVEKLVDVSAVTYPAYSETTVALADDGRSVMPALELHSRYASADLTVAQMVLLRGPTVRPRSFNSVPDSICRDRSPGPACR